MSQIFIVAAKLRIISSGPTGCCFSSVKLLFLIFIDSVHKIVLNDMFFNFSNDIENDGKLNKRNV